MAKEVAKLWNIFLPPACIKKNMVAILARDRISHLLNLSNMTSHNSYISYPP